MTLKRIPPIYQSLHECYCMSSFLYGCIRKDICSGTPLVMLLFLWRDMRSSRDSYLVAQLVGPGAICKLVAQLVGLCCDL